MAGDPVATWPTAWLDWLSEGRSAAPLGGNVTQQFAFAPLVSFTGKGDPALERAIVTEVASYGAQIGHLSEIVLALAEGRNASRLDVLRKLHQITEAVARKKTDYARSAEQRARDAMMALHENDPAAFAKLSAGLPD